VKRLALLVVVLGLACIGTDGSTADPDSTATDQLAEEDSIAASDNAVVAPDTTMPDYPREESGRLTARANGMVEFDRSWPAHAGWCADPTSLLVLAQDDRSGASLLLVLADSGTNEGRYPVMLSDSAHQTYRSIALVGFQFLEDQNTAAYQGTEGVVELLRYDSRVSGRFAIKIHQLRGGVWAQVAGVFHNLSLKDLRRESCLRAGAASDSTAPGEP
jgi:hypothetical protein